MTRTEKRRHARNRRLMRRDLVHAAGCTEPRCFVRMAAFEDWEMINEALAMGISIPRSIERRWQAAIESGDYDCMEEMTR